MTISPATTRLLIVAWSVSACSGVLAAQPTLETLWRFVVYHVAYMGSVDPLDISASGQTTPSGQTNHAKCDRRNDALHPACFPFFRDSLFLLFVLQLSMEAFSSDTVGLQMLGELIAQSEVSIYA